MKKYLIYALEFQSYLIVFQSPDGGVQNAVQIMRV
jgi:hypothetical protein